MNPRKEAEDWLKAGGDKEKANTYALLAVADAIEHVAQSIEEFLEEATEGDYDHLLQTCMRWVEVS